MLRYNPYREFANFSHVIEVSVRRKHISLLLLKQIRSASSGVICFMMKSRLFLGRTIGESSSDAKERRRVVVVVIMSWREDIFFLFMGVCLFFIGVGLLFGFVVTTWRGATNFFFRCDDDRRWVVYDFLTDKEEEEEFSLNHLDARFVASALNWMFFSPAVWNYPPLNNLKIRRSTIERHFPLLPYSTRFSFHPQSEVRNSLRSDESTLSVNNRDECLFRNGVFIVSIVAWGVFMVPSTIICLALSNFDFSTWSLSARCGDPDGLFRNCRCGRITNHLSCTVSISISQHEALSPAVENPDDDGLFCNCVDVVASLIICLALSNFDFSTWSLFLLLWRIPMMMVCFVIVSTWSHH